MNIAMAKQHDNQRRINGLELALTEVRANCSDSKLTAAHQERIKAQQDKVAERELEEERQEGDDREKIAKRERKLEDARQELKKLQAEPY
nr:YqjD [Candidatus Pantoea persica]